jgi:PAS domain S-box-containing protein
MEELQATQEEAARQSEKFVSFTNSVNHTLIRAEYLTDGTLIYANTKFLNKLGYSSNLEVEGKHISMFINKKDREWFEPLWDELAKGG